MIDIVKETERRAPDYITGARSVKSKKGGRSSRRAPWQEASRSLTSPRADVPCSPHWAKNRDLAMTAKSFSRKWVRGLWSKIWFKSKSQGVDAGAGVRGI